MLRATDFMDNWLPSAAFTLKVYRTMLLRCTFADPGTRLFLVSTRDIGRAGARAVHEREAFVGSELVLAGDHRTMREVREIYREVMGADVHESFGLLARIGKWADPDAAKLSRVGFPVWSVCSRPVPQREGIPRRRGRDAQGAPGRRGLPGLSRTQQARAGALGASSLSPPSLVSRAQSHTQSARIPFYISSSAILVGQWHVHFCR